jgi:hypothetical protein
MRQSDTSPTERVPSNPVRPVLGKQAEVLPPVKDRYKRTVARIKCSGVDANTEQVKRGMAWVYRRYSKDHNLYVMQHDAKVVTRGLWADSSPIPSWDHASPRQTRIHRHDLGLSNVCSVIRSGELAQSPHPSLGFLQHRNNLLHSEPFLLHANLLYSKVSFAEN